MVSNTADATIDVWYTLHSMEHSTREEGGGYGWSWLMLRRLVSCRFIRYFLRFQQSGRHASIRKQWKRYLHLILRIRHEESANMVHIKVLRPIRYIYLLLWQTTDKWNIYLPPPYLISWHDGTSLQISPATLSKQRTLLHVPCSNLNLVQGRIIKNPQYNFRGLEWFIRVHKKYWSGYIRTTLCCEATVLK